MAKNPVKGAIKHIHVNFDLRPLIKVLERADDDFFLMIE